MKLTKDMIEEIRREMAGLSGQDAKDMAIILSNQFMVDVTRIYHYSKAVRPRRKQRADAGNCPAIPEETFKTLAYYTVKHDLSADHIKEIAAANGLGNIDVGTFNRRLRQAGINRRKNKKDLRPYISWEASEPNVLHQIDSTVSQQFYLDDSGIGYEQKFERYKNKRGNQKPRITLLSLKDDHSRVIYARFFLSNNTYAWMEFLYQAWKQKEDDSGFPFHGLPTLLYSDNDSVIKSGKFNRAMQALGVKVFSHKVRNSRAKGKVENSFKILQEFEKVTQIEKFTNLDEANEALLDFLYYINNRRHTVTGQPPFQRWAAISADRLRAAPNEDLFRLLHRDVIYRQIRKDMTVSIDAVPWQLPFRKPFIDHVGEMTEIYTFPGETDKITLVLDDHEYEVQFADKQIRSTGNYDPLPEQSFEELKKEIAELDTPGLKITGIYKDRHRRTYLPHEGKEFDDSRIAAAPRQVMRSKMWFISELQKQFLIHTPIDADEQFTINGIFAGVKELPEDELKKQFTKFKTGFKKAENQ